MFKTIRKLHPRGAANRGVCVDADGAMLGPDWPLVERVSGGYRVAPRGASRDIQKVLFGGQAEPDWLYQQGQRIADALNRSEIALAQIYGLRIPVDRIDERQLTQLARLAKLHKAEFDPNEPRVPAGQPGGGEWTTGGEDTSNVGAAPNQTERDSPSTTASGGKETAPVRAQYFDQQSRDENQSNTEDGSADASIVPAGYTVAPDRGGRDAPSSGRDSGVAGVEAYLIEAGYTLTPELWKAVRALYRLYVTPGSTLFSLQAYLAENGLKFDELPSVIRSLFDPPKPLTELQPKQPPAGFYSEAELLKYVGDPLPGYEWHHIIEQNGQWRPDLTTPEGVRRWIQTTDNVVMVPVIKHYCINGIMSWVPQKGSGVRIRDIVRFHSPLSQRFVGLGLLKACGAIQ